MRCTHVHDSAAYVLGALSPGERGEYEEHMSDCPVCRTDVAQLAVLPGLLGRLDRAAAEDVGGGAVVGTAEGWETMPEPVPGFGVAPIDRGAEPVRAPRPERPTPSPSPDRLPALLAAARVSRARERRRRRWQTAAAVFVAACAAVFATIGVRSFAVGSTPKPAMEAMTATGSGVPMTAEIALHSSGNATLIRMHCHYDAVQAPGSSSYTFRLYAVPKSGGPGEQLRTWDASFGDDMNFAITADVRLNDMQRVELRKNDGTSVVLAYDVD